MAGGCSRCSQEFQSKPCTRFGFKCWTTIAPLTVKILRLRSGLKFPSQAVWSARLPGPCTPITLCFCGLLFTWACWAVAAVGRLALAPGHRLVVVVSLPSLVLPHNSASKGTAPSCAADRSCPSPVSRQLRHLRPLLLLLLLCRPSWCRGTQALYFDKNCGLVGWSWLFLVDELVGVGRETRLVREGGSRD